MKLKSKLLALFSLCVVCILTGCVTQNVQDSTPELNPVIVPPVIHTPGLLTVGIQKNNPPFSMADNSDQQGFDVDLASALALELGLKVKFIPLETRSISTEEFANQNLDIIMGASSSEEHDPSLTLLGRYIENAPALFTITSDGKPALATQQDVERAQLATQANSVSHALVKKYFPMVQAHTVSDINKALELLKSRSVKYVACDACAGSYVAKQIDRNIVFAGALDTPSGLSIALVQKNQDLSKAVQKALDTLMSNGTLSLLKQKWFPNLPTLNEQNQVLSAEQRSKATVDEATQTDTASSQGQAGQNTATAAASSSQNSTQSAEAPKKP